MALVIACYPKYKGYKFWRLLLTSQVLNPINVLPAYSKDGFCNCLLDKQKVFSFVYVC